MTEKADAEENLEDVMEVGDRQWKSCKVIDRPFPKIRISWKSLFIFRLSFKKLNFQRFTVFDFFKFLFLWVSLAGSPNYVKINK